MSIGELRTILDISIDNVKRWKWRLCSIAVLVAVALVLHISYSGSLEATMTASTGQVRSLHLPFDYMIQLPPGEKVLEEVDWPPSGYNFRLYDFYESATELTANSIFGEFDILGLKEGSRYYTAEQIELEGRLYSSPGEIVLPRQLAEQNNLKLGDKITVFAWESHPRQSGIHQQEFSIVGIYEGFDLTPALVLLSDANALSGSGEPNRFLINYLRATTLYEGRLLTHMQRTYPMATIIRAALPQAMSRDLQQQRYQPGQNLLLLISLFVCIGVLTIAVMTFLERRKELAALKTVGISNKQIVLMLVIEYSLAEIGGLVLGSGILLAMALKIDWLRELPPPTLARLILVAVLNTVFAVVIALVYPLLTARVATVNQMLYARRIPLRVKRIDHMENPRSLLVYRERKENVRILKLLPHEEAKDILMLKKCGELTKLGEVVATQEAVFGFYVREWLAPCDGEITECDDSGIIAIRPSDPNTPFYPYPIHLLQMEQRREEIHRRAALEAQEIATAPRDSRTIALDMERRYERSARLAEGLPASEGSDSQVIDYVAQARAERKETEERSTRSRFAAFLRPAASLIAILLLFFLMRMQAEMRTSRYYISQVVFTTVQEKLELGGFLSYQEAKQIRNPVAGKLSEILVSDGVIVHQNQPLLILSDPSLEEALTQAKINLISARQSYDSLRLQTESASGSDTENYLSALRQQNTANNLSRSIDHLVITAPSNGRIIKTEAVVGDTLRADEALFAFYNRERESSAEREIKLLQARARLDTAQRALKQLEIRAPFSGRIISVEADAGRYMEQGNLLLVIQDEGPYSEAKALELKQAQLVLEQKKEALDGLTIRASIGGILSGLKLEIGDNLSSGDRIALLSDDSELIVRVDVPQNQISGIQRGNLAEVTLSHNGRKLQGTVSGVADSGQSDPLSRMVTFPVEISLPYDGNYSFGMTASVIIYNSSNASGQTSSLRGTLQYSITKELRATVPGKVSELLVENGDRVIAGQIIALVSNESLRLSYAQTEEQLNSFLRQELRAPAGISVSELHVQAGDAVQEDQLLMTLDNGTLLANFLHAQQEYNNLAAEMVGNQILRTAVAGTLQRLYVAEGDEVVAGQILAELDNADLRYQSELAETNYLKLEAGYLAAQRNPESGALATARLRLDQAEATVALYQQQIENLIIRAPRSGQISYHRDVKVGEKISRNQLLASVNGSGLQLLVKIDELSLQHLHKGTVVTVDVPAYPDDLFWATVVDVDPVGSVTESGVFYQVQLQLEPDPRLMSGMSATAALVLREAKDVLAVRRSSLRQRVNEGQVEDIVDRITATGRLLETPVVTGLVTNDLVEIVQGVKEGEAVADELSVAEPDMEKEFGKLLRSMINFVRRLQGVQ